MVLPLVIRTREISSPASPIAPKKEKLLSLTVPGGTALSKISLSLDVEKLDRRAISQIHIGEYRAETTDRGRHRAVRARNEEGHVGYVASNRGKYPLWTEHAEGAAEVGLMKAVLNPPCGPPSAAPE